MRLGCRQAALNCEAVLLENAGEVLRCLELLESEFAEAENLVDHLLRGGPARESMSATTSVLKVLQPGILASVFAADPGGPWPASCCWPAETPTMADGGPGRRHRINLFVAGDRNAVPRLTPETFVWVDVPGSYGWVAIRGGMVVPESPCWSYRADEALPDPHPNRNLKVPCGCARQATSGAEQHDTASRASGASLMAAA